MSCPEHDEDGRPIHRGRARHHFRGAGPVAALLIVPIRLYQRFITSWTPATCRFYPSCSAYAVTALRERGAVVGLGLTLRRLARCHPWSSGGVDHVPASARSLRRAERRREAQPGETGRRELRELAGSSTTGPGAPDQTDPSITGRFTAGHTEKSTAA